ncbi:unnamed protein product [Ectocarpus sp. 4 AP-2014]
MSAALGPRYDRPLENDDDNVFSQGAEGPAQGVQSWLEMLRRSSMFTLALLTLVVVLLFADQNLLAPNLSAIAEEFGFNASPTTTATNNSTSNGNCNVANNNFTPTVTDNYTRGREGQAPGG